MSRQRSVLDVRREPCLKFVSGECYDRLNFRNLLALARFAGMSETRPGATSLWQVADWRPNEDQEHPVSRFDQAQCQPTVQS